MTKAKQSSPRTSQLVAKVTLNHTHFCQESALTAGALAHGQASKPQQLRARLTYLQREIKLPEVLARCLWQEVLSPLPQEGDGRTLRKAVQSSRSRISLWLAPVAIP